MRWTPFPQDFDFDIIYIPGEDDIADCLTGTSILLLRSSFLKGQECQS